MTRYVVVIAVSLSLILAGSFSLRNVEDEQARAAQHLRVAMVDLQNAQQDLNRITADRTHPLLTVLGEDIAALQIRMAETLADMRVDGEPVAVEFRQSVLDSPLGVVSARMIAGAERHPVNVLRFDVQAQLFHAPQLLRFLHEVSLATTGWPSDIRACRVDRMVGKGLDVHCIIDIYHWSHDAT